jgi:adenylate cyclase
LSAGGELLVASGVADELMRVTPRRRLNLRGHDRPIGAFVLGIERGVSPIVGS